MNLKVKIKQYGFKNSLIRAIKYLLRRIAGVQYESFYLMVNHIDPKVLKHQIEQYDYSDVKELAYEDFTLGDHTVFTPAKMQLIKSRFETGKYWAYGIFINNELAYSTWISFNKLNINGLEYDNYKLNNNQAILEDSHCHQNYRGRGLHTKMNYYRLKKINEMGFDEVIVIVLKENKPAIKVQLKSGFKKNKTIRLLKVGPWKYISEIK